MKYCFALVATLCCSSFASSRTPGRIVEVEVPPSASIQFEGDPAPTDGGVPLVLRLPAGSDGKLTPPRDVRKMVHVLRNALPKPYLKAILYNFGFEDTEGSRDRTIDHSVRLADLYRFLFDHWRLDSDTRLAREIRCISWGEKDLTLVLYSVAQVERRGGSYRRRTDLPVDYSVSAPLTLADRLLKACSKGH